MELWQALLVAFGGNAALLLVLGFLGRSLLSNVLTKDLETFKGKLQLAAIEHEIRYSKLHEKRAETVAELYRLLAIAVREAESFASPVTFSGEPEKWEKYRVAMNSIVDYYRYFDERRIYVSADLCMGLHDFAEKLRTPLIGFGVYLQIEYPNDNTAKDKMKAWTAAWDSVQKDIPPLRAALEIEFRQLLGVSVATAT